MGTLMSLMTFHVVYEFPQACNSSKVNRWVIVVRSQLGRWKRKKDLCDFEHSLQKLRTKPRKNCKPYLGYFSFDRYKSGFSWNTLHKL